eukprot:TRINITY_DN52143_c0_g1_i1.p1 TRINITY_DN52143_c0_g1~~TRINITY_DN52143_c0_g1_i1.p1  ORF type:complete len:333 (+),score=20.57 TRINITY_DN52143_c0_g1_i1:150-1001(+)
MTYMMFTITETTTVTTLFVPTTTTVTSTRTSTTTSTMTTSTTTTTTTTDRPCTEPSALLTPLFGEDKCKGNLSSGEICKVRSIKHPCFEESEFMFSCPKYNTIAREPILLQGIYTTKCKTCKWHYSSYNDTDPRKGFMNVQLTFGPLAILGRVDESAITGYGIFLVDNCSRPILDHASGYIEVNPNITHDPACCISDTYVVDVVFALPLDHISATLMILPNTTNGFLPMGDSTGEILDSNTTLIALAGTVRSADIHSFELILILTLSVSLAFSAASHPWTEFT